MESTVLNHSQQNILRMLAFVREEQTVSEIENVLKEHFAKKLDSCLDKMIDDGSLTMDTIESWASEHMRTPYK